jgi:hypothetical protein
MPRPRHSSTCRDRSHMNLELPESSIDFKPVTDSRPLIPIPPPVRLVAVDDVRLQASAGLEIQLDAFYVDLLQFERDEKDEGVVYRAENFRLRFEFVEQRVEREDFRMIGVEIKSLDDASRCLREVEIEFARERGLTVGQERLLLQDPAGNWLWLTQSKPLM